MMSFLFGQTNWYKEKKHKEYIERYKDCPTGHEIAFKYNVTQSPDYEPEPPLDYLRYSEIEHRIL